MVDAMTMLQVRNLSPKTHEELKRRAARVRMSLSDYVANQLDLLVRVPSQEEFWDWGMSGKGDEPFLETKLGRWPEPHPPEEDTEEEKELQDFIVNIIREHRGPLP